MTRYRDIHAGTPATTSSLYLGIAGSGFSPSWVLVDLTCFFSLVAGGSCGCFGYGYDRDSGEVRPQRGL